MVFPTTDATANSDNDHHNRAKGAYPLSARFSRPASAFPHAPLGTVIVGDSLFRSVCPTNLKNRSPPTTIEKENSSDERFIRCFFTAY